MPVATQSSGCTNRQIASQSGQDFSGMSHRNVVDFQQAVKDPQSDRGVKNEGIP
ncbi:hypothetical protein F7734_09440 [Scytonema sp. UIC 10036]|uniref:hypothetical protein n=1 Tax=Scytonema sp. UIC 10036 TaxID=2304196 RepID=UPI0012DAF357|nr:hypothetical protein [Scytonema sp. UIC 10036]MUG92664.1 hypothetical protein [Scytonema sp. UIC 10036]